MATKRLIDANAFVDCIKCVHFKVCQSFGILTGRLTSCPTYQAEAVHGEWRYYSTTMQECSNCHRHTARHKFKYCPHCGAVMEDKYNDG